MMREWGEMVGRSRLLFPPRISATGSALFDLEPEKAFYFHRGLLQHPLPPREAIRRLFDEASS